MASTSKTEAHRPPKQELMLKRKTTDISYMDRSCRAFDHAYIANDNPVPSNKPPIGLQSPPISPVRVSSPYSEISSAASSPNASDNLWSLPATPEQQRSKKSCEPLTPFSPLSPETPNSAIKHSREVSYADLRSKAAAVAKEMPREMVSEDPSENHEGYFQPKKLIRNMTMELERITRCNAASANLQYRLDASTSFLDHDISYTPSKRAAKVKSQLEQAKPQLQLKGDVVGLQVDSKADARRRSNFRTVLENILPVDIRARLQEDPYKCVASLVGDAQKRCKSHSPGSAPKLRRVIKGIRNDYNDGDWEAAIDSIENLVAKVMCGRHRNVALSERKDGSRIGILRNKVLPDPCEDRIALEEFQRWINLIVTANRNPIKARLTQEHDVHTTEPTEQPSQAASPKLQNIGIEYPPTAHQSYLAGFQPYQLKKTLGLSVRDALLNAIEKPLSNADLKKGYIYTFWDAEHFGHVKIGRTIDLQVRLKEWNSQCKRKHYYHTTVKPVEIPHAQRLELLIHTELKESRLRRKCEGCGVMHQEWFNPGSSLADKVLQKWQDWMLQEPYAFDEGSGTWTLRADMLDKLDEICQPIREEEIIPRPRRSSNAGKRKGMGKQKEARRTI